MGVTGASTFLGEVITDGRQCVRCEYVLDGLRSGDRCPECGTPIMGGRQLASRATLTDAPVWYLKSLALGCWLLLIGVAGSVAFGWLASANRSVALGAIGLIPPVLWWAGVFIVTQKEPRPDAGRADLWPWLRPLNRMAQGVWLLLAMARLGSIAAYWASLKAVGAPVPPPLAGMGRGFGVAENLVGLIGLFTLIPFSIQMSSLASWASDDELTGRMRGVVVGLSFGAVSLLLATVATPVLGPLKFVAAILLTLGAVSMLFSWFAFMWSVLGLARMASWAVANAYELMESRQRMAAKYQEHVESLATPRPAMQNPSVPIVPGPGERVIPKGHSGPIPLAEPEGPPKVIRQG